MAPFWVMKLSLPCHAWLRMQALFFDVPDSSGDLFPSCDPSLTFPNVALPTDISSSSLRALNPAPGDSVHWAPR